MRVLNGANTSWYTQILAGVEGVEPSLTEPESAVLPLDDTPVLKAYASCPEWAQVVMLATKALHVNKKATEASISTEKVGR